MALVKNQIHVSVLQDGEAAAVIKVVIVYMFIFSAIFL